MMDRPDTRRLPLPNAPAQSVRSKTRRPRAQKTFPQASIKESTSPATSHMSLAQRLEAVYRQERQRLFACAFAVLGEAEAAEDAVHAAFEKLLARDVEPDDLVAYVFQTVRNSARDIGRRTASVERVARRRPVATPQDGHPASELENQEVQEHLARSLASIEPLRREIIELHLRADLKFREIAEMMDLPLGTVTSHYRRGIEQLRKLLTEDTSAKPP